MVTANSIMFLSGSDIIIFVVHGAMVSDFMAR